MYKARRSRQRVTVRKDLSFHESEPEAVCVAYMPEVLQIRHGENVCNRQTDELSILQVYRILPIEMLVTH